MQKATGTDQLGIRGASQLPPELPAAETVGMYDIIINKHE
jgi:hypothetical protein